MRRQERARLLEYILRAVLYLSLVVIPQGSVQAALDQQESWPCDSLPVPSSALSHGTWTLREEADRAVYEMLAVKSGGCSPNSSANAVQKALERMRFVTRWADARGLWWSPTSSLAGDPNVNRFILASLSDALYVCRQLVTCRDASDLGRMEALLRLSFDAVAQADNGLFAWDWGAATKGQYPNQDVQILLAFAIGARIYDDASLGEVSDRAMKRIQAKILRGGGFNYINDEDESPIYHGVVQVALARYYRITGDARALVLLDKSVPYWEDHRLFQRWVDFWGDVWWKSSWRSVPPGALKIATSLSGSSNLYEMYRASKSRVGSSYEYSLAEAYALEWPFPSSLSRSVAREPSSSGPNFVRVDGDRFAAAVMEGVGRRVSFAGAAAQSCDPLVPPSVVRWVMAKARGLATGEVSFVSYPDARRFAVTRRDGSNLEARIVSRLDRDVGVFNSSTFVRPPGSIVVDQVWSLSRNGMTGSIAFNGEAAGQDYDLSVEVPIGSCYLEKVKKNAWRCGDLRVILFSSDWISEAYYGSVPTVRDASNWSRLVFTHRRKAERAWPPPLLLRLEAVGLECQKAPRSVQ